jgi:hypothetical protein
MEEFGGGDLREGDHLEDLGINGRKVLKSNLREVRWGGIDWIDLAQDRDRCRVLLYAVMNFQVPYSAGNFLTSWGIS